MRKKDSISLLKTLSINIQVNLDVAFLFFFDDRSMPFRASNFEIHFESPTFELIHFI